METNAKPRPKYTSEDEEENKPANGTFADTIWNNQLKKKEILINRQIDEDIIERAVIQIYNINDIDHDAENDFKDYEREPIKLWLNTNGGSVDDAFSLISAILSSKTPVMTIAMGRCMSAGFLILLAGHIRAAQRYSNIMYHQISAGMWGEVGKHQEYSDYWLRDQKRIEEYIKARTKIPKKRLDEIFNRKHDWYITPEEAMQLKIIDMII